QVIRNRDSGFLFRSKIIKVKKMPEIIPQKRLDPALHGFKLAYIKDEKQIPELKIKILKLFRIFAAKDA
ncbi:MAG TPA: hypothetical protein VN278_01400, partial [Methanosarcina sp.]|nr:hypothetical protein [Methanosarcina sp.]